MRLWNAQVYAAAVLVCGLTATNVNADPITTNLFYTTSAGPPSFGAVNVAGVTLGPSDCPFTACPLQLTINSITPLASLNGAHGIVFAPDGNHLLIAGGRTDPVHVHEIKLNGVFVGDGILPPGNTAYHLALGPAPLPFTGTVLRVECNSDCGPHYSRFLPLGSPITTGPMAESVEVFGPPGADRRITGLAFDPANGGTWYYGATPDGSIAGEFGTITFGEGAGELHTDLNGFGVPAYNVFHDPFSNDIILDSGPMVAQFDPLTHTIVSSITVPGEQFDGAAVDGKGHLFVASHTGDLLGIDYSTATGHLINGPGATGAVAFLAANLAGVALQPTVVTTPEPGSIALLGTGLLALTLFRRRSARV